MGGHGKSSGYKKPSAATSESELAAAVESQMGLGSGGPTKAEKSNIDALTDAGDEWGMPDYSDAHMGWSNSKDIWDEMGGGYNNGGVGGQQARDMASAIKDYTDGPYKAIRNAYWKGQKYGEDSLTGTEKQNYKKAKTLTSFIDHGVKAGHEWTGGITYRGVPFDKETFKKVMDTPVGEYVDPNWGAPASWSTKAVKSSGFSGHQKGRSVIFCEVSGKHKGAVSVRGLSTYYSEAEVLASPKTQYKKLGQTQTGNILYVFVRAE